MKPKVYFSREITPEKVVEMYNLLGKELEVIFEKSRNGRITGWSDNYLPIKIKPENIAKEAIIEVKIIKYCPDGTLLAEG